MYEKLEAFEKQTKSKVMFEKQIEKGNVVVFLLDNENKIPKNNKGKEMQVEAKDLLEALQKLNKMAFA